MRHNTTTRNTSALPLGMRHNTTTRNMSQHYHWGCVTTRLLGTRHSTIPALPLRILHTLLAAVALPASSSAIVLFKLAMLVHRRLVETASVYLSNELFNYFVFVHNPNQMSLRVPYCKVVVNTLVHAACEFPICFVLVRLVMLLLSAPWHHS